MALVIFLFVVRQSCIVQCVKTKPFTCANYNKGRKPQKNNLKKINKK